MLLISQDLVYSRVTGYVIRFVKQLKGTLTNESTDIMSDNTLTIYEYKMNLTCGKK